MSKRREAVRFVDGDVDEDAEAKLQEHLVEEAQGEVVHAWFVPSPIELVLVDVRGPLTYAVLDGKYDPDQRDEYAREGDNHEVVGEEMCIVARLEEHVVEPYIRSKLSASSPIVDGFV